jgi:hypothetical protein
MSWYLTTPYVSHEPRLSSIFLTLFLLHFFSHFFAISLLFHFIILFFPHAFILSSFLFSYPAFLLLISSFRSSLEKEMIEACSFVNVPFLTCSLLVFGHSSRIDHAMTFLPLPGCRTIDFTIRPCKEGRPTQFNFNSTPIPLY